MMSLHQLTLRTAPSHHNASRHNKPLLYGSPRRICLLTRLQAQQEPKTVANDKSTSTSGSTSAQQESSAPQDKKAQLMQQIKSFGLAGTLSYVVTELVFWALALPGAYIGYHQATGEWLSLETDKAQLVGMAAAFVTGVRFAVPLRMGVALALVPTMKSILEGAQKRE